MDSGDDDRQQEIGALKQYIQQFSDKTVVRRMAQRWIILQWDGALRSPGFFARNTWTLQVHLRLMQLAEELHDFFPGDALAANMYPVEFFAADVRRQSCLSRPVATLPSSTILGRPPMTPTGHPPPAPIKKRPYKKRAPTQQQTQSKSQ